MKRVGAWFLLAMMIAGCIQIGPGGSGSGATGAGGEGGSVTPSGCDDRKSCGECQSCAGQSECADELAACQNNAACVGLDQCIQICGADADCKEQCYIGNAPGAEAYDAALRCLYCDACTNDCKGFITCSG